MGAGGGVWGGGVVRGWGWVGGWGWGLARAGLSRSVLMQPLS
jgi:hypothetical protein